MSATRLMLTKDKDDSDLTKEGKDYQYISLPDGEGAILNKKGEVELLGKLVTTKKSFCVPCSSAAVVVGPEDDTGSSGSSDGTMKRKPKNPSAKSAPAAAAAVVFGVLMMIVMLFCCWC